MLVSEVLKLWQVSAGIAVPVMAEVEAAPEVVVVAAGLLVFGFVMEVEESGTGPAEKAKRWSVYLEQHSEVSEVSKLVPWPQGSEVVAVEVAVAASFASSVAEAYQPGSSENLAYHPPSYNSEQSSEDRPTRERLGHRGRLGIVADILPSDHWQPYVAFRRLASSQQDHRASFEGSRRGQRLPGESCRRTAAAAAAAGYT